LYPTIAIRVDPKTLITNDNLAVNWTHLWKASVSVLTVTQARTNRSKVIAGGGPYPVAGCEAEIMSGDMHNVFARAT